MSEAARAASLEAAWNARPARIAVFAYGSLMWDPCFEYADRRPATLTGYHRAFAIWSVHARGTPRAPGLGLGLEPAAGGLCHGILYTLPRSVGRDDLVPLWEREMWTDTYRPAWLQVTAAGEPMPALGFVIDETHRQYAGRLEPREAASYIASAAGKFGTCRDYLAETVSALHRLGIADPELEELLWMVDE